MNVLTFAGSFRADSLNKKHAREAARLAAELGHSAEFIDLRDYPMPIYDGDIEAQGVPSEVTKLGEKMAGADALILSTPEYNFSIPGGLKNVIDWLSRLKPMPLAGKHILLLGATPGALSAVRGMTHTRQPLDGIGMFVYPGMLGLGQAHTHFGSDGKLSDDKAKALKELIEKFLKHAGK